MESTSFFPTQGEFETPADVAAAMEPIEALFAQNITKTLLRDFLMGFKILVKSVQQKNKHDESGIILQWLRLYLRLENALNPSDYKLRAQFDKYIPATISYIAAALQLKPKDVPQYHHQLLEMSLKLLEKSSEETLKKVATLESGLIACFWLPIDFVGDFNTQMAALRLMIKLLKCIDDSKQQKELEKISSAKKLKLRDSICGAVRVANFHAGKFENAARELLNNYNMNLAPQVLVYSMRCKSVKFEKSAAFYKPFNTDYLWIDLNYCPRTLTFNARYRANNKEKFVNVGVCLQLEKLTLNKNTLIVVLSAPPYFSKNLSNQDELKTHRTLQFELYVEEALRLQENHIVLDYYNDIHKQNTNVENTIMLPSPSDATSEDSDVIPQSIINPDKAEITTKPQNSAIQVEANNSPQSQSNSQKLAQDKFQKSYRFLIGMSDDMTKPSHSQNCTSEDMTVPNSNENNATFKLPSLPAYENALLKAKLSQNSTNDVNEIAGAPTQVRISEESPKTSRPNDELSAQLSLKDVHPIAELACPKAFGKRRFFKKKHCSSDSEFLPKTPKRSNKTKTRKPRLKYKKIFTSPPKRKQVNKVKPMNHLAKCNGDPLEAVEEYVENGGILNITNFLSNGNESAAVFNEDERRIILQNVHRINDDLERTAQKFFHNNAANVTSADVYDNQFNVSDAEPGQSYRNFRTGRRNLDKSIIEELRPQRTRNRTLTKSRKRVTKKNNTVDVNFSTAAPSCARRKPRKRKAETTTTKIVNIISPEITSSRLVRSSNLPHNNYMSIDLNCRNEENEVTNNKIQTITKRRSQSSSTSIIFEASNENIDVQECRDDVPMAQLSADDEILPSPVKRICMELHTPNLSDGMNISDVNESPVKDQNASLNFYPMKSNMNKNNILKTIRSASDECILYHHRSDDEWSENSDEIFPSDRSTAAQMEHIPLPPCRVSLERVATNYFERKARRTLSMTQPTVTSRQVTTTSVTTHQVLSKDIFLIPTPMEEVITPNIPINNKAQNCHEVSIFLTQRPNTSSTSNSVIPYFNTLKDSEPVQNTINKDIIDILQKFKENFKEEFRKLTTATKMDLYVQKVAEISTRLLEEMENERIEMEQSEKEIEKIISQLNWHWETYQKKTERFNCFKHNMEQYLNAFTKLDFKEDIDMEYEKMMEKLQKLSKDLSTKFWQEFMRDTTEDLIKNLSNFSSL